MHVYVWFQDAVGENLKQKKYVRNKPVDSPSPSTSTASPNSACSGLLLAATLLFFSPSLASCFQGLSTVTVSSTNPDEMDTQIAPGPTCKLPDRPPPVYLAGMMANIHSHPPSVNPQLQLKPSLKAMLEASNTKTPKGNAGGNQ